MLQKPHYIALGVVVVLTLIILNLPDRTSARLKLSIGSLFLPLFGLKASAQGLAGKTGDVTLSRRELIQQNETLRRENQQLRLQAMQGEETLRENARLRQLLGWKSKQRWNLKLANVVLRDPANWWRTVEIDVGRRDGITNNMPVLNPDGFLLGRIASAGLTRSQVVLLGDPNCRVAARVENETGDTGIIGTAGPLDSEIVEMGFLSKNANLKPGQNVRTSGEGGIFPKGILIGRILDVRSGDYGLNNEGRVKLAANVSALEEVWVVFP
jgi:rod shape-determining protein MreC